MHSNDGDYRHTSFAGDVRNGDDYRHTSFANAVYSAEQNGPP
jgi:hypothetical protein